MNTNIEMNDIKAKVSMLKADNERLTLDASDWREKHRLACAENVLLLDQRDTCWESHKGYEAENERLCMELVEKDMLPARLRATITQQDELLNMHDAELERLQSKHDLLRKNYAFRYKEVQQLRAALEKHGRHAKGCACLPIWRPIAGTKDRYVLDDSPPCTCGYAESLK